MGAGTTKQSLESRHRESLRNTISRIMGFALIPITFVTLLYCFYFVISEALK